MIFKVLEQMWFRKETKRFGFKAASCVLFFFLLGSSIESMEVNTHIESATTWRPSVEEEWRPKHCPLCNYSMIFPEKSDKNPALIFLDIDGVLIKQWRSSELQDQIWSKLKELFPKGEGINHFSPYQQNIVHARFFDQEALENLDRVIEKVLESGQRPLVVLSSSWRHSALLHQLCEDIYYEHMFSKYLCGKTPVESETESYLSIECRLGFEFYESSREKYNLNLDNRANAIEFWLKDHGFKLDTTNFIAIDDSHTEYLSRFGKRFIKTRFLFSEDNARDAVDVLCGDS